MTENTPARHGGELSLQTVAAGLLLAAAILLTGTLLANGVKETGSELVVTQVFAAEGAELTGAQNKLLRQKTVGLLSHYVFALADAAINFDTVPKLDTKIFLSIATSMPEEVQVTGIAFEHYDVLLACEAKSEAVLVQFLARLEETELFESVVSTPPHKNGEMLTCRITCSPKISEGQLTFAPAD